MNNREILFDLVGQLARQRYQAAERGFAPLGLNHTEARLLTLLDRQEGPVTQDTLSAMIHVDRSNAGRALQHLERAGQIQRTRDATDKRTNMVQLTDSGRSKVAEIANIRASIAQSIFGDLTEGDAGVIVQLLSRALTVSDDE